MLIERKKKNTQKYKEMNENQSELHNKGEHNPDSTINVLPNPQGA